VDWCVPMLDSNRIKLLLTETIWVLFRIVFCWFTRSVLSKVNCHFIRKKGAVFSHWNDFSLRPSFVVKAKRMEYANLFFSILLRLITKLIRIYQIEINDSTYLKGTQSSENLILKLISFSSYYNHLRNLLPFDSIINYS